MRLLVALALAALLLPLASAQEGESRALLEIDVQSDHGERLTLRFEGLRRLTEYHGICLPERARESRVHDELGDVPYTARDDADGRRVLTFSARSETVTIDMARPAPEDETPPLHARDVNFCVPTDSAVSVRVRVPERHALFFLSDGGAISSDRRSGTSASDGPTHLFYTYEAPLDAAAPLVARDEGALRVYVAPELAERAAEVARLARAPLADALAEAGLDMPFDRLRVLYARETPHAWESGHYGGQGYVSIKADTLDADPTKGYPYHAVKVLVHEAFHAASFPHGKGEVEETVSWWLEGTARHAERHVDRAMPNASIHCVEDRSEVKCWSFDDRIERRLLDAGYAGDFSFDTRWEPSLPQDEDTRRFYYGYSEFVVGAWIARHGEARYRAVWDEVLAAFETARGCPCRDGWLVARLGESEDALFRPWAELKAREPAAFEARVAPFVKDEAALQAALEARAGPFAGIEIPAAGAWGALVAVGAAAAGFRRRR